MAKGKEKEKSGGRIRGIVSTYRGEFKKIVWPSRMELARKTFIVVVISLMFGAYIALLDGILGALFTSFVGLLGGGV
jgi:preprotein translocase SecE subunit